MVVASLPVGGASPKARLAPFRPGEVDIPRPLSQSAPTMDAQRGIARRFVVGLPRDGLDSAWERDFSSYLPAGVIVFRRDFQDLEGLRRLTRRLRELARPRRLFIAIDEEGGWVSQLAGHLTVPPNALLMGRGAGPGETEWASRVTARRLRALGIDWVFAPVADVHSEPRNPVIGPRAYAADAPSAARRVAEAVRGFAAAGVSSCLKHFPGHGATVLDSHLALPVVETSREVLEERELEPFRANLAADAVMTAHVVVSALDPDRPATFSRAIAHDLLRLKLGFEGVTITDALEMRGAAEGREPLDAARLALEAGCDLLLFASHDEEVRRIRLALARDLADGRMARDNFDAARGRLARLDRMRPEPTEAELDQPVDSLTPVDWEERLERIVERGLVVDGDLPPAARGPWSVSEPESTGGAIRSELERLSVPLAETGAAGDVVGVASRTPLPGEETERLRARCRERPTVLVGLQNDAFLEDLPEAAIRVSACDATPLTCRVVARALAARLVGGA